MNLKAPIYFSTGLTEKANHYYKLFITWTNQKIRKTFVQRNMFEFKHIKAFDRSYADNPGPMASIVLYALEREKIISLTFTMLCIFRWCLLHLACCTPASLCRSLRNGLEMRRTWWDVLEGGETSGRGGQKSHQLVLLFQVIMPGYCVQGTIGHKILNGQRKLEMEGRATVRWFFFLFDSSPNVCQLCDSFCTQNQWPRLWFLFLSTF